MRRTRRALLVGVLTALAGCALVAGALDWDLEERYGLWWLHLARGPVAAPPDVVIVDIGTPRHVPRAMHAQLIDELARRKPSVIVFDIFYAEASNDDLQLGEAIARAGSVVLAQLIAPDADRGPFLMVREPVRVLADNAIGLAPAPVTVTEVSRVFAFLQVSEDDLGIPTLPAVALQAHALPSLSRLAVPLREQGLTDLAWRLQQPVGGWRDLRQLMTSLRRTLRRQPQLSQTLALGLSSDRDAPNPPADRNALAALLRMYEGPSNHVLNAYDPSHGICKLPYEALLTGDELVCRGERLALAGRAVFVGDDTQPDPWTRDRYLTVYSTDDVGMSGVEVAATAFANLLTGQTPRPVGRAAYYALLLVFGAVVGFLGHYLSTRYAVPVVAGVGLGYFALALLLYRQANVLIPVAVPLVAQLPAALFVGTFWRYLLVRRFLPTETAEPGVSESVDGICLTTDVSTFTAMAEGMSPGEVSRLMSEYFEILATVARRHGALITGMAGDRMICVWKRADQHARADACQAALDISAAVDRFNEHAAHPLRTRLGLHAGRFDMRTIGGAGRYEYQPVGDVPNTAVRIEDQNKSFGTRVLASEAVVRGVSGFALRHLGAVPLKGKSEPLGIVEILGRDDAVASVGQPIGHSGRGAILLLGLAVCLLFPSFADAQARCTQPVARVVSGQAIELREVGAIAWRPAAPNVDLCPGDGFRTGENSRATVLYLATRVEKRIGDRTEVVVRPRTVEGRTLIDLIRGVFYFFSIEPRALEFTTPFLNGVVQGTEFVVSVDDTQTTITVIQGEVLASNPLGSVAVTDGQSAVAAANQAPQLQQLYVQPRDAVQWALYYEPILPGESLEALNQVPEGDRDAAFFARRASARLSAGQLAAARDDIDAAVAREADNGEALALRTIIDVALDERERALESSGEAVERAPQSASARIARSYALQANFELEAARDELLEAVAREPDHAQSWARLAELWLSLGYLDRAHEAASRAASLSQDLARTQTVLGFAALTELRLAEATAAFDRAIVLESDAPLAHLGRGLAAIREGRLAEGLDDLRTAVMNDPRNALFRSYLGKAYVEERREAEAARQFAQAKALDANDPTPLLYDAIRKQALNRPVEALQDLQESIARNDNRAVYRSRLLLDQDLAARSAGLGRIYRDLGFEQLALVQGWTSVNDDATDHSGHRFLADVYSALPRHEIARVSELLQSQLLQPVNVGAVQPQLAETNLSIINGVGPAEPAFNEFHPLFNRNRVSLLVSGAAGGNDTLGDELVVSGVWNRLSFSAGQFHFDSEGFQENNAQDRDILNAFVQASLTHSTGVQAEVRATDDVRGDLRLRFDPAQLRPFRSQVTGVDSWRLGLRHAFSPQSKVIASFIRGKARDEFDDRLVELGYPGNPGSLAVDAETRGWTTEGQHLFSSERVRLVSGVGRHEASRQEALDLGIRIPVPPFDISQMSREERQVEQTNVYLYSQADVASGVTLSLGASGDFLRGRTVDTNQFNPKIGVSWRPTGSTTLRAAGFRTLYRALISEQTIEPTQVAGFNQFFDGVEGERAWRYGLGVDQKLSSRLYGGAEFSWRTLDVPGVSAESGNVTISDWNERFGRGYLYATPNQRMGLSLEYLFDRFTRAGELGEEQIVELSTHRVPLGLAFFHPNGFIGRVRATIVRQTGIFGTTELPVPGEDSFAVVDASVGYRLPKRYGIVTLDIKNLFNQEFRFQDTDPRFPRILPRRLVVIRFTVSL